MKQVESSDFEGQIEDSAYLVKFGASWCSPCHAIKPTLEALETEQKISVYDLDIDDFPSAAQRFGIRSVPTVVLMKNGKPVEQLVGARQKADYEKLLKLA